MTNIMPPIKSLFSIQFQHAFFTDGRFNRSELTPDEETTILMNRLGLLFRKQADGAIVLGDLSSHRYTPGEKLLFRITLKDPDLYNYTELLPPANGDVLWFSSSGKQWTRQPYLLHEANFVSEQDHRPEQKPVENRHTEQCFGHIEIALDPLPPKQLYICFLNRSVHWRYIFTGAPVRLMGCRILDSAGKNGFAGPERITLSDGRDAVAFDSIQPVALLQHPMEFQLVDVEEIDRKKNILIKNLPAPVFHGDVGNNRLDIFVQL